MENKRETTMINSRIFFSKLRSQISPITTPHLHLQHPSDDLRRGLQRFIKFVRLVFHKTFEHHSPGSGICEKHCGYLHRSSNRLPWEYFIYIQIVFLTAACVLNSGYAARCAEGLWPSVYSHSGLCS